MTTLIDNFLDIQAIVHSSDMEKKDLPRQARDEKIGVSYAGYFNRKYDRSGHLFQDRYLSENIENDKNLLTVFRYILRNPEKTGISIRRLELLTGINRGVIQEA